MTIIAPTRQYTDAAPAPDTPRARALHNAALMASQGRDVSWEYWNDPVNRRIDGSPAPEMDPELDPAYGEPTTAEEIARSVDNQLIGADGTGLAPLAHAARFTRKRRAAGVARMTLAQVMSLQPFRVFRALAEIIDADQIHSPYVQLLDLVLTARDRTEQALAAAQAADAAFPAEQMSLDYVSRAEQILAELDPAPVSSAPDMAPELIYRPEDTDTATDVEGAASIEDAETLAALDAEADTEVAEALAALDDLNELPGLPVDDRDSWVEIRDLERAHLYVATDPLGQYYGPELDELDDTGMWPELADQALYS